MSIDELPRIELQARRMRAEFLHQTIRNLFNRAPAAHVADTRAA